MRLRERIKWLLFPGINLHARLRYRVLPRYFSPASPGTSHLVLDAGCGNGMLSYKSCLLGNRVIGVSIKESEVRHNRQLFNEFLGIPEDRLKFTVHNLYAISELGLQFDEVICSEVLEHLRRDREMIEAFASALKPGGVLHLCCPNAEHPDNAASQLDPDEKGGHVRPGYTIDSYRKLLEPAGFRIVESTGIGGPVRQAFNKRMIRIQERAGFLPGFALFVLSLSFVWLDPAAPKAPYSIYVRAVKEAR